jgi:hypothetical protein
MKGVGEPIFEHDFPPGSDIVGDILRGPRPAERMEFELFGRLAAQVDRLLRSCSSSGQGGKEVKKSERHFNVNFDRNKHWIYT